ncbi:hypothetical protein [Clostridium sp. UBA1652]|uniref:hypothetical protein n=1 Tax=Clostridium sp. UBA1652 TaxID=1946348 RepID=UPI00257BDA1F|nr:hypothetical protein [Clostridium sp. UBA1652]
MNFFNEEKFYRVKIIETCPIMNLIQSIFSNGYLPSNKSFNKGSFGFIPVGITGWIIKKFNKKYFLPDENQEGLDLFIPTNQTNVLISYYKIEKYCEKV